MTSSKNDSVLMAKTMMKCMDEAMEIPQLNTPAKIYLFLYIALNEGLTGSEIIKKTGMGPALVYRSIEGIYEGTNRKGAVGAGLVVQKDSPDNKLSNCLYLTKSGKLLLEKLGSVFRETIDK
ncbi:MAG: hypothetical protein CMP22_04150 [Rickettsiales bacterium]|nr:hypothetical protein [Rickettsiales bacterium]|tara:strand:+ start:1630 stop:1995 length:366 start_codon:yes stop_codon:yes gene_type:complete